MIILSLGIMTGCGTSSAKHEPSIPRDAQIEKKVKEQLSKMSLDDKIGQMLQLELSTMGQARRGESSYTVNETKMDSLIGKYRTGSVLNTPGRAVKAEHWYRIISDIQKKSLETIGIPCIYGLDQNHGASYVSDATIFPQPINLAASFNTDLAFEMGQVTAYESRAANCPWVFNPVLDLGRDPRWPRIWESFGEDAIVNSRMVEKEILGYQGADPNHLGKYNVAACVKHYFAYGAPFTGKDRTPAYISPAMLREKYFAPFKAAIEAGALSVMVNSSSINGVPVHASYEYLTKWLKEDLNWNGVILTDWSDINNLYTREMVATDKKDAIRIAINAGIDMSMDPYSVDFCIYLKELVEEGKVSMKRIDDAVSRILRLKYRLGLFDTPNTGAEGFEKFASAEFASKAYNAALESEVLLKNADGILPLAKGTKILITGPNANQMRCLDGGWSYSWQGSGNEDLTAQYNTIYEAFCNKFGAENIILEKGVSYNERGDYYMENRPEIEKAVAAAKKADVIVACIGENSYCETPGNLTDLWLSENQRNLVKALAATGKPVILVLNEGRPRLITDIEPLAKAVIDIFLPGNYGADALVDLIAGDANFSAKMPYTYPREINSLANYDYKMSEEVGTMQGAYNYDAKVSLLWPFGYGLSYTNFEYYNLKVDRSTFTADDILTVSVDVKNTGPMAGKEAVLLYSSDLVASVIPDNKRLRDFTKIELEPRESRTVTFSIPARDLAFVSADGSQWMLEEGDFVLKAGRLSVTIRCSETAIWPIP
ncbi:MAG: glycoside hydrolase family 3 C-terminal domain-containing protein [Bacteroidaceae bacterium]|nr:glycoside hydrolase family 3 C-terminal domain-containing protein [Bacteroidaceae bacterium]